MKMKKDLVDFEKYIGLHSPGYVIEIYNDGESTEIVAGDRATKPYRKKCNTDTLYDIASLTKVFAMNDCMMGLEQIHDRKGCTAKKLGIITGHASVFTTGVELMKFLQSLLDERLVSPDTTRLMLERRSMYNI